MTAENILAKWPRRMAALTSCFKIFSGFPVIITVLWSMLWVFDRSRLNWDFLVTLTKYHHCAHAK